MPGGAARAGPGALQSPVPEEAASSRRGDDPIVSRYLRALRKIERDLAAADPGLDALFRAFAGCTDGCDMSWVERTERKRFLVFGRRRRERTLSERVKEWTAENWQDP